MWARRAGPPSAPDTNFRFHRQSGTYRALNVQKFPRPVRYENGQNHSIVGVAILNPIAGFAQSPGNMSPKQIQAGSLISL